MSPKGKQGREWKYPLPVMFAPFIGNNRYRDWPLVLMAPERQGSESHNNHTKLEPVFHCRLHERLVRAEAARCRKPGPETSAGPGVLGSYTQGQFAALSRDLGKGEHLDRESTHFPEAGRSARTHLSGCRHADTSSRRSATIGDQGVLPNGAQ